MHWERSRGLIFTLYTKQTKKKETFRQAKIINDISIILTEMEKITKTLQNKIQLSESEIKVKEIIEESSNSEGLACKLQDDEYALLKVESLFQHVWKVRHFWKQTNKESRKFQWCTTYTSSKKVDFNYEFEV